MDKLGYIPAPVEVHVTHSQYRVTNDMCWKGKHVTDLEQDARKQRIQDGSRVGVSDTQPPPRTKVELHLSIEQSTPISS